MRTVATDTRSLRRRNRWAACIAATAMSLLGSGALHFSYLRLERKRQVNALESGAKALETALESLRGSAPPLPVGTPSWLLWAVGMTPELPRLAHPDFAAVAREVQWPSVPGETLRVALPDGRSFRLLSTEAKQGPPGLRLYLALETTRDEAIERDMLIQRLVTVAAISLASLLLADLIFREAMRPLKNLAMKAASIRPKELGQRLDLQDFPVELHDLVASLNITLERLQEAFQRMEHLSTDLAHELRSPIQNIRSEVEGLLLHPPDEDERNDALGSCLEELDRLGVMIEQMLFLARCEDPGSELRMGAIAVPTLLQEIADYFEASAENAGVSIQVEAEDVLLLADRSLIQRALGNLVSNALRHTPSGGRITLRGRSTEDRIHLEIQDTGEGIPPDVLPRLGTRFTRVEDSRSRSTGGSGLGLAIVKGIMRLHGGTVELESRLGEGTLARLEFRKDPTGRVRAAKP